MRKIEESGSHQPTVGPHQGNDNPHQAASGGSQPNHSGVHPQQRGGREQSRQTVHSNSSQSRERSYASYAENDRDMQHEIDELKKKLRRARRKRASFESESSLGIQKMIHIGKDLGLHLVKPSPVAKSTVIMGGRAKVPPIRAWETKL